MDMVVDLLSPSNRGGGGGGEEEAMELGVEGEGLGKERGVSVGGDISGRELILPCFPRLLEYLSRVISEASRNKKMRFVGQSLEQEFLVLSRWVEF